MSKRLLVTILSIAMNLIVRMAMMTVEKGNGPYLAFVAVRVLLVTSGIMLMAAGLVRMEKKTETP